jgi:hypothetical protein
MVNMNNKTEKALDKTKFFVLGWVDKKKRSLSPPQARPGFHGDNNIISIHNLGRFYFNKPWYIDLAENEVMACIKFGQIHDGTKLLSAEDILMNGWVTPSGITFERIYGNGAVIVLSKTQPHCFVYRNLLSAPPIYYYKDDANFIVTDNLRVMLDILPTPQLNENVLIQHFLFRGMSCGHTYVQGVRSLLTGEQLSWDYGEMAIELKRKISDVYDPKNQINVNDETVELFLSKLKAVLAIYLKGKEYNSATMLSGGVDSSLLQMAINELGIINFPSFSFRVESKDFDYEVQYAKDSMEKLGTLHTFYSITPEIYRDSLIKSTEILGRPVIHDVIPCFYALSEFISSQHPEYSNWYTGYFADGLHGVSNSLQVAQGDKYRSWPVPILNFLGKVFGPISQSKSYGAIRAAETLSFARDTNSPQHHLNSVGQFADWDMITKCFDKDEIFAVYAERRNLIASYIDSEFMVENMNTLDLLTDGVEPASVVRQQGLYWGGEYIAPYGDDSILQTVYSFEPLSRYTYSNKVKPILKMALGSRTSVRSINSPKGWSGVGDDLWLWMKEGVMQDMVHAIERPGFIDSVEFERKLQNPDWFMWNLLTLDVFIKSI